MVDLIVQFLVGSSKGAHLSLAGVFAGSKFVDFSLEVGVVVGGGSEGVYLGL